MKKWFLTVCALLLCLAGCGKESAAPEPETLGELLPLEDGDYGLYVWNEQAYGNRLSDDVEAAIRRVDTLGNSRTIAGYTILSLSGPQREELTEILDGARLADYEEVDFQTLRQEVYLNRVLWLELVKGEEVCASLRFYQLDGPADAQGILVYVNDKTGGGLRCFLGEAFDGFERLCRLEEEVRWDRTPGEENVMVTGYDDPEGYFPTDGVPRSQTRARAQYLLSLLEWELREAEEEPSYQGEAPDTASIKIEPCQGQGCYWVDLADARLFALRDGVVYSTALDSSAMFVLRLYLF